MNYEHLDTNTLAKRIVKYAKLNDADPRAIGLLYELQAHLRAANKGSARKDDYNKYLHKNYWEYKEKYEKLKNKNKQGS